jgi:formate/nitrite transporter FocA (FNT family)
MEQKTETRSKIIKVIIWVVAIMVLLGTMHILVNSFDILDALKSIHGQVRLQH